MINPMSPTPPPALPSDAALMAALSLLSSLGNLSNTTALLDQVAVAKKSLDDATAAHNAAAAEAKAATDALSGVKAQAEDVATREKALVDAQLQLRVASSAAQDRDRALDIRATSLDQREQELAAKEKAHSDKIASVRAALA